MNEMAKMMYVLSRLTQKEIDKEEKAREKPA